MQYLLADQVRIGAYEDKVKEAKDAVEGWQRRLDNLAEVRNASQHTLDLLGPLDPLRKSLGSAHRSILKSMEAASDNRAYWQSEIPKRQHSLEKLKQEIEEEYR